MKRIAILFSLLLLGLFSYGQTQSNRFLTGKVICTQTGSGLNTFTVSCNFTDEGGLYDGTNVAIGDYLYFTDGGYGYYLPIDSILTSGPSTIIIRVGSAGTGLGAIPSSIGYISKSSDNFKMFPFVSGLSFADQQINSENTFYTLDSILYYRLPERISGSVPPAYTPTINQAWLAQSNGDGKLYRYDPLITGWVEIGGIDTLNGIYSGSDTIHGYTTASIDSIFELISLDKPGHFYIQYGSLSGSRLLLNDTIFKSFFNDVSGNSEIYIDENGITLLPNSNGSDDIKLQGSLVLNKTLSPSTILTNQNNYNPTGLPYSNVIRLSSSSNINITGLGTSNNRHGRLLILQNTGSFNITLKNNSGSSTSGNQFLLSDDFTMSSNDFIFAQYDTISDGWRIAELPRQYVDSLSMNGGTLRISLFNDKTAHKELNMTENIQDIVGNMIGAQTNIAVTYNDATGKISYVASGGGGGGGGSATIDTFQIFNDSLYLSFLLDSIPASVVDLSKYLQYQDTFSIVNDTLYSSISDDSMPSKFVSLSKYLQTIDTFRVNSSNVELSISNDGQPIKTIPIISIAPVQSIIGGTGISVSGTNNITITNTGDLSNTNEIQYIDTLRLTGTTLETSLFNDGLPLKTVDLSSLSINLYTTSASITDQNRVVDIPGNLIFSNNSASTGERFTIGYDNGVSSTNTFDLREGVGITLSSSENNIFLEGQTSFRDVLSPSALTGNVNNYTGLNGANVGILSSNGAYSITGIDNGVHGRILFIFNNGSFDLTLTDQDVLSDVENRFYMGSDYVLKADTGSLIILYDTLIPAWRVFKFQGEGGVSSNIYTDNGTTSDNTRTLTITEALNFTGINDLGDPIPFQVNVTGNEPQAQLWDFGTDSLVVGQSDTEIYFKTNTNFLLNSDASLIFQSDSVLFSNTSVENVPTVESILGFRNIGGNPTLKQVVGTQTGHVLVWDEPNQIWELDVVSVGGGDDWGAQYVQTDSSLQGRGLTSNPLTITGYDNASNGQVPSKQTDTLVWITPLLVEVDGSITNEIQQIDTFEIVSNILRNSLSLDGVPFKSVDLTPYLDNTDAQNLTVEGGSAPFTIAISGGSDIDINSGTGINLTESPANTMVITNSLPDVTVSLTNGGGVGVSGTYPNFTLTATDQSVTNEIQRVDTFEIVSNILRISLLNDAVPFSAVDLSSYSQNIYNIDGTQDDGQRLFTIDSTKEFGLGQFNNFPDVDFDGTSKGLLYSPDYWGEVGLYNGDGLSGSTAFLSLGDNSGSINVTNKSGVNTTSSFITALPSAKRNRYELTSSGYTNPLGDNRIWQSYNDTTNYIAIGHNTLSSTPSAYFVVGIGGRDGAFLDKSPKRKFAFQFHKSPNLEAYNILDADIPSVASDTTSDFIGFYNGSYRFQNERPSNSVGDTSIHVWIGDGSGITNPAFVELSSLLNSSKNIYNSDGTVPEFRTITLDDNIYWDGTNATSGSAFTIEYGDAATGFSTLSLEAGTTSGIILGSTLTSDGTATMLVNGDGQSGISGVYNIAGGGSNLWQVDEDGLLIETESGDATTINTPLNYSAIYYPASFSTNQNNYNPTGLEDAYEIRITTTAAVDITGLTAQVNGRELVITNIGAHPITLKNQSGSSTAANRFAIGYDFNLAPNVSIKARYNDVTDRWSLNSSLSPYTGSGRLAGGRDQDVYMQYTTDTLNDFALGYFTNGTSDDKTTYGKFGLHMDGDGGFSVAGKETYIKGTNFNLLSTSYVAARTEFYDLYASKRSTVGGVENTTSLSGTTTENNFSLSAGHDFFQGNDIGLKKDLSGTPSNKKDYGYLFQGGGETGGDTSAISVWWGLPQRTDTISSMSAGDIKGYSKERGFGVQSLFEAGSSPNATLKFDWLKIKTGIVPSDTLVDGITFYGNKYEIPNATPPSAAGDTSVIVWTSPTNSFFIDIDDIKGGGSGGNGIYGGDGNIPNGGSQVTMDTLGETVRFVSDLPTTSTREMLRLSVAENAFTRFLVFTSPVDSARFFRASAGREYTLQTYGGSALTFSSDSIVKFVGDSLLFTEDIVPLSGDKIRYIAGVNNGYYVRRIEGLTSGNILVSDGTDWVRTPLSTAISSSAFIQNGNSFAASAVLGTNDNNSLNFEVNNVTGLTLGTDYSLTATASIATTNTRSNRFIIQTNSTGTAAASFGSNLLFRGESSTTNNRDMLELSTQWITATDATRNANFIVRSVIGGTMTELVRFYGNSVPQMTIGNTGANYFANSIASSGSYSISSSSTSSSNAVNLSVTGNNTSASGSFGGTAFTTTTGTKYDWRFNSGFSPSSGTGLFYNVLINPTINQTGGANGNTGAIIFDPTLTAVGGSWSALSMATSNSSAKFINQTGANTTSNHVGSFMFGSTSAPSTVAAIEISSTTKGLLLPRMTTTERDAITAVAGLVIFNTTTTKLECYDGTTWQAAW